MGDDKLVEDHGTITLICGFLLLPVALDRLVLEEQAPPLYED